MLLARSWDPGHGARTAAGRPGPPPEVPVSTGRLNPAAPACQHLSRCGAVQPPDPRAQSMGHIMMPVPASGCHMCLDATVTGRVSGQSDPKSRVPDPESRQVQLQARMRVRHLPLKPSVPLSEETSICNFNLPSLSLSLSLSLRLRPVLNAAPS
jgi:hypothetical protein